MTVSTKPENTPLYQIISFVVAWIDFIARTYLRIKANYDAVLYVAQTPAKYQHYSHQQHHQRRHSVYKSTESIHVRRKSAPSSTIPVRNYIHGGLPAYTSGRNRKRSLPLYYGVSKVARSCDVGALDIPEPSAVRCWEYSYVTTTTTTEVS